MSTEMKNQQITVGSGINDSQWHYLTLSYDENASDENELKVYMDGSLLGATGTFGGSLKFKDSHEWLLGTASLKNPSLGRFIGKIDDFRFFPTIWIYRNMLLFIILVMGT